jgi:hypothetical protein
MAPFRMSREKSHDIIYLADLYARWDTRGESIN